MECEKSDTSLLSSFNFRWYPEIIVNATTFLVIATMDNFVLVRIMECANVENVFAIQNGIVQVIVAFCLK